MHESAKTLLCHTFNTAVKTGDEEICDRVIRAFSKNVASVAVALGRKKLGAKGQ